MCTVYPDIIKICSESYKKHTRVDRNSLSFLGPRRTRGGGNGSGSKGGLAVASLPGRGG